MKKKNNKIRTSYEPEADVLSIELTGKPIDYAKEVGNIVVHFTKHNIPVLVEILDASRALSKVFDAVNVHGAPKKTALVSR